MSEDKKYMRMAIEQARLCNGGPTDPLVGAVVVLTDGRVLAAHRGENKKGEHAEYTLLESKLKSDTISGSTIYTTLEPCTCRGVGKVPCADRIIERRVARVVIGMLDPDQRITGQGILKLRNAGIAVDLSPPELTAKIEELNRDFTRDRINETLVKKIPQSGFFVWNGIEELQFSELLKRANEIWIIARSGVNMLSRHGNDLKKFLSKGGVLNLMITNPKSELLNKMYNSNDKLPKANINVTLSHLESIKEDSESNINVRYLDSPPNMGILLAKGKGLVYNANAVIQIMLYPEYSSTGSGRPMICVLPSSEPWYTVIEQDVVESWKRSKTE